MSADRKLPSDSILVRWVEAGMTHKQIAERVTKESGMPVSRAAVSTALSRAGLTNRIRYDDTVPWRVRMKHQHSIHLWMLRVHHRLTHDGTASEEERKRYSTWRKKLDENDAVIMYVEDSPDGFYVVPRDEEVDKPDELITMRGRDNRVRARVRA